jgi:hypothetical protein
MGGTDKRTNQQKELWLHSANRIERILPGFLREAVPPTRGEVEVEVPAQAHEGQGQVEGQVEVPGQGVQDARE